MQSDRDLTAQKDQHEGRGHWVLPLVAVLCVTGLIISVLAFQSVSRSHNNRSEADFQRDADRRVAALEQHLAQMTEQLRSLGAFYRSSSQVGEREFRDFTAGYIRQQAGLSLIAWAIAEFPASLDESIMESDDPTAGVALPLQFLEPGPVGRFVFNFDLSSDISILEAISAAFTRGHTQHLIDSEGLIFVTPTLDKIDWSGVAIAVLPIDAIAAWTGFESWDASVTITQVSTGQTVADQTRSIVNDGAGFRYLTSLSVNGEIWEVDVNTATDGAIAAGAWVTLFTGAAMTTLLSFLIVTLNSSATRAQQMVRQRTRELEQAEREARAQAVRLADKVSHTNQIISSIPSLLIGVNSAGVITEWNRAVAQLSGISKAQAVDRPFSACGWQSDLTEILDGVEVCISQMLTIRKDNLKVTAASGSDATVTLTFTPFRTSGEYGCLIIGDDTTEHNSMELQLREAQRLEAVGRLASGIAHEVNTPAQFVSDNTSFLKDAFADLIRLEKEYSRVFAHSSESIPRHDKEALEKARQDADCEYLLEEIPAALEQSAEGIRRIADIVRAMKEFSHPGSAGNKEQVDLNHLIENAVIVAANEWKYHANVVTELDENLPSVMCYPRELNQVILNLLINGAHAIADRVGGSGERGELRIETSFDKDVVCMRVSDTGTGIPEDARNKIFEPFFTTKEVGRGSGQGLALAYSAVVEQHDGEITFDTEIGVGTTFFVKLPLNPQEAVV